MKNSDLLYGLEDQERLDSDPELTIEKIFEENDEDQLDSFTWPIKVYEYKRMNINEEDILENVLQKIDHIIDDLDEEYGDPDGDMDFQITEKIKKAAENLSKAIKEDFIPWACGRTGNVILYNREGIEEKDINENS